MRRRIPTLLFPSSPEPESDDGITIAKWRYLRSSPRTSGNLRDIATGRNAHRRGTDAPLDNLWIYVS